MSLSFDSLETRNTMESVGTIDLSGIAQELNISLSQVERVTELLDAGNTVPFITRYRKEQTGNLDEEQIRAIQSQVSALRQLSERTQTVLRLIEAQGKLTPQLRQEIEQAGSLKRLEDLYLPFRPKRRSRAMQARERGLEPLAERIWNQDAGITDLSKAALEFVNPDAELPGVEEVLQGVSDILAERVGEDATVRDQARRIAWKSGRLVVAVKKSAQETGQAYRDYFDYSEAISRIPPHRALAINRGETERVLRVKFEWDEPAVQHVVVSHFRVAQHRFSSFVTTCINDAIQRLVHPSLERELRRELTDRAESHAVTVFARNLRNLLLQAPLRGNRVLAVDPGFRTGCKIAALDEFGQCLATDVVYVTGSEEKRQANVAKLAEFITKHQCQLAAIGNGTACREAEELISETIATHLPELRYLIVNEAGASIYSTSTVAREEFPDFDATIRGTISIGRRLQDPLSELVKIDPQHIGVGMYQHDVTPKLLKQSLDDVIESCVNFVGVDLNTASASLLRHVSGLNQLIARRVVEWREKHGQFKNRRQLREVAGVGETTFTQAAGFLKIAGGDEPLDSTWIHPESYEATHKLLTRLAPAAADTPLEQTLGSRLQVSVPTEERQSLATELDIGLPTLDDILEALARPGRDPRSDQPGPIFRKGVLKLDDLHEDMELTGTVLNVVDFGVFVDIGLKDSGLVHISKLANRFVASPHEIVAVGDVVTVWVLAVDYDRRRVSLTMVKPGTPPPTKTNRPTSKPAPKSAGKQAAPPKTAANASTGKSTQQPAQPGDANRRPANTPQQQRTSRPKPPATPPPEISPDMEAGREPLRGFDELRELWRKRDQ